MTAAQNEVIGWNDYIGADSETPAWYPVDLDALAECVPNDEKSFIITTDSLACEELLATGHPNTQTMFLPGASIPPTSPPLPPLVDWREYTALIIACLDVVGKHQANELARYLKRSGVGSVKIAQVSP